MKERAIAKEVIAVNLWEVATIVRYYHDLWMEGNFSLKEVEGLEKMVEALKKTIHAIYCFRKGEYEAVYKEGKIEW